MEQDHRRGYTADKQLDGAILKMTQGRPSQSLAILMSHGANPDAYNELLELHFRPPESDPQALTDSETARYEYLRAQPPTPEFEARVRAELQKKVPKLRSGVGSGPSGERYEHLAAAAKGHQGLQAISDMGLRLSLIHI